MKKLLATILALVMALGVTTISWADEEGAEGGETAGLLDVVYVNTSTGDDTNGTGAETSPVKYLKKAMTLVKEGGIIRVTGQTTVNPFWGNQNPDKTIAGGNYYVTKSVTIEGYGEEGMHDLHGIGLDLRRDHDVRAEDTVGLLGLFKHAGEHFLEDGHIVIGGLGVCLLAEVFKDDGVGLAGRGGKCAAQAETASVGRRDAQAGDRIRTHAGLDDGVFEPDKLGKSGFDHDVFLLSNAVYDRQCAGMLPS